VNSMRSITTFYAACPDCGAMLTDAEGVWMAADSFLASANEKRAACPHCGTRLWTLKRPGAVRDRQATVKDALCQLPTIGPKTADKLMARLGADTLGGLLADNPFDFIMPQGGVAHRHTDGGLRRRLVLPPNGGCSPGG